MVSDDSASGKSTSAPSTSEFGHESLTKIIEAFLRKMRKERKKKANSIGAKTEEEIVIGF
jgi:hypothetical protein